ncbi:MAG: sulfurtransferase TusA family protein [Burkholderiaceae bacterium]|nr:MAG: sulfurtransferase TusA family protein [Burkholderiaceae bacterium]
MPFDNEIDACGLKCPLPILRTKKALAAMESGQVLKVLATDTSAVNDFSAFARQTGNALLGSAEKDGVLVFYLRRR